MSTRLADCIDCGIPGLAFSDQKILALKNSPGLQSLMIIDHIMMRYSFFDAYACQNSLAIIFLQSDSSEDFNGCQSSGGCYLRRRITAVQDLWDCIPSYCWWLRAIARRSGSSKVAVPWFNAESHAICRNCHRLEQNYRKTNSIEDWAAWTEAVCDKFVKFWSKKNEYWTKRITNESQMPAKLWRSMM